MSKRRIPKYPKPRKDERGYILAVSNLVALYNEVDIAGHLLREYQINQFDGRSFTEFDQAQFRRLNDCGEANIKVDPEEKE